MEACKEHNKKPRLTPQTREYYGCQTDVLNAVISQIKSRFYFSDEDAKTAVARALDNSETFILFMKLIKNYIVED